jgi:hypothetical protein
MIEAIKKAPRKKRSDRTHILYRIDTADGFYIGITAKTQSSLEKSLQYRFGKHLSRATREDKPWSLYVSLRKCLTGKTLKPVSIHVLTTVRGKAAAHTMERELIRTMCPNLNTF